MPTKEVHAGGSSPEGATKGLLVVNIPKISGRLIGRKLGICPFKTVGPIFPAIIWIALKSVGDPESYPSGGGNITDLANIIGLYGPLCLSAFSLPCSVPEQLSKQMLSASGPAIGLPVINQIQHGALALHWHYSQRFGRIEFHEGRHRNGLIQGHS